MGKSERWSPDSWHARASDQQPDWPDRESLDGALAELRALPPLVFAGESRQLRAALAAVAAGEAFLLHVGDCAESFRDLSAPSIRDNLKIMLQMATVLTYGAALPVVKLGRVAGQFAKPRSSPTERVGDLELPSFRGHMVNDDVGEAGARAADPARLLQAYHQSTARLNLLRAFTKGGFADLTQVHLWNQEFVARSSEGRRYERIARGIDDALRFMAACGIDLEREHRLHEVDLWTSHEGLILPYEECLTRRDSLTGDWYDCSAHLLWIGERTRNPDHAHVEFFSGVQNPLACKLGPEVTPEEAVALCERLDPDCDPGRLTLIVRLGADRVESLLPPLIRAVGDSGHPVVWACDPMHGNGLRTPEGIKTRRFDDIMRELRGFFDVCRAEGVWPGGVHLEFTGDDVTECVGGAEPVSENDLGIRYSTLCDPRLNARQSLDVAFQVAELLRPKGARK
ncbi:MAG TPA: 3-deoxy-7-phosphoheptulonate synthase class II [Thermoleophilia bacterium]|nr:3-deoxy-7-phosphoheptulonate synthase class II [Thermoleophilia bacterium]